MAPSKNLWTCLLAGIVMSAIIIFPAPDQDLYALEKKVYKIGIPTDKVPFVFVSWTKTGRSLRGAYIDVMTQIAHYMGVKFQYVKCSDPIMSMHLLHENKIDIMGFTLKPETTWLDSEQIAIPVGLKVNSWLFINNSCKTIVCAKDLADKRVAVIGFDELGVWPYDTSKESQLVSVHSPQEGLSLLNEGHVDAFIAPSEKVASYIIHKQGFVNVRRVGLALRYLPLSLSVPKKNARLHEELTEAIEKTKASGVIRQIRDKWYGVEFKQTFFEKYSRIIFSGIGFVLLILGFVLTWNRQLKNQVKKITIRFKTSESRYRNLIESSPDMIFVLNREGRIYTMNREALFLMPLEINDKDIQPNLTDILSPADKKKFSIFLKTVFIKKRLAEEFRFKDRRLGYREIDVAATLLPSEPGEEQKACLFARDVTRRNRIERDLVQADRMAIIGQMATDVAHEINNPIGIVRANIDVILSRGWFSPEAKGFLESCKRNTVRAGEFTKDLLAMAKPKVPELKELDLWELIKSTIEMMGAQLKDVNLKRMSKGDRALVLGDRNLLQQVLVNLLLNAAVAMKQCPIKEISITCCVPKGFDMVRLRVEDKGVGIPKKHLNEVFEPFFTQGKKEGFGLGLFISKRIVENHNGIIYAESEINIGTQFIIELPLFHKSPSLPKD